MLLDKLLSKSHSQRQREHTNRPVRQKSSWYDFAAGNRTPDEMLSEGTDTVIYLLDHRYIEKEMAEELLRRMLAGYISYTVEQQLEDAIVDAVALSLSELRRGDNG